MTTVVTDSTGILGWTRLYEGAVEPALELVRLGGDWGRVLSLSLHHLAPRHMPHPPFDFEAEVFDAESPIARACGRLEQVRILHRQFDKERSRQLLNTPDLLEPKAVLAEATRLERWLHSCLFDSEVGEEPEALPQKDRTTKVLRVAIRSLVLERAGDFEGAEKSARQASRMARTESIPFAEFFAHLALARARRVSGGPHLASRILASLSKVVPHSFEPWLRYELALSAGPTALEGLGAGPIAVDVLSILKASAAGDLDSFDQACAAIAPALATQEWARRELELLQTLLDPRVSIDSAPAAAVPFLRGQSDVPPRGLHGASGLSGEGTAGVFGYVVAAPGGVGRRVLCPGHALTGLPLRNDNQPRVDTTRATLALGGVEGLEQSKLFEAVWGFSYRPRLHSGSLRTVLHRARASDDLFQIDVSDSIVSMKASRRALLPDPRCVHSVHDRLLRVVASRPNIGARELAELLNVQVRTTQRALSALVEEGWCERVGAGRAVTYRVEDTTFSEPTYTFPSRLA